MRVIDSIQEMREYRSLIYETKNIGFVPTMGYLHEGHLSLVEQSNKESDITIVSIYVNPTQFGENEDLQTYPRDIDRDLDLLCKYNVDAVFYPNNKEMYPEGYLTWVEVEKLSSLYCGRSRPTHFKGVSTIVSKLINIVRPLYLYMGEKDFQQIAVLKKMIEDLNYDTYIRPCPIVREIDGLALSSRNAYLNEKERRNALSLYEAQILAKEMIYKGERNIDTVISKMRKLINEKDGRIDYIEFVDPHTLELKADLIGTLRVLMAVYIGKTRLIDNFEITIN
ncbi:MAG: pantoate--beta-alanine ligase [Candidatus Cloacimonetes bacterium]|nr:pantoate--beta-alanine ligase [Candidatus Cloacimonadota bacterium]MDD2650688.1 pantoate--beta-alanine ligase [Candidatus Cloacimonadota bacterium]MDD3501401.1 pantoate--beta-alanine ligase [Candidatus Cloacimonadota bacterium]